MKKKLLLILTLPVVLALSACGSNSNPTPPEPATATEIVVQPTQPPATTEIPTIGPTDTSTQPTEVPATAAAVSEVSFAKDIMPIFENSCINCHGGEKIKEGLDLKTYESLMAGSFNGLVIEPGNAQNSFLVQQIVEGEMPKRGKLSEADIQAIIDWVNAGALNN